MATEGTTHVASENCVKMTENMNNLIQNGDKVILKKENNIQVAQIHETKKTTMDRSRISLYRAVGYPYGTTFEIEGNDISPVDEANELKNVIVEDLVDRKDNRNIKDTSDSQKLSREEIEDLRKQGETGEEVVRHLIENSATFNEKTEYSKEKYIKKKRKKHVNRIKIVRPCTRLLAEMYFNKGPARINNLRIDTLAQMLSFGDVKAHNRQLVVESCNGLLLGATMERMGGHGTIIQLHAEQDPPRQALEGYNFTPDHYKILHHLPLRLLGTVHSRDASMDNDKEEPSTDETQSKRPRIDVSSEPKDEKHIEEISNPVEQTGEAKDGTNSESQQKSPPSPAEKDKEEVAKVVVQESSEKSMEVDGDEAGHQKLDLDDSSKQIAKAEQERRRLLRLRQIDATRQILQDGKFDSLLVATRVHPTPIVLRLLGFLADSRPVAVFSPYQEPLIDCYQRLRDSGSVVHLRLSETWLRNYQVLPNRTHPEINMSMNGGYLLTFIKVSDRPAPPSTG